MSRTSTGLPVANASAVGIPSGLMCSCSFSKRGAPVKCRATISRPPVSSRNISTEKSWGMTLESCADMAETNSSTDNFETSALVISNSVCSRSRSRTASCLARKESTATANSLATRSRKAISAGLGSSGATELKPSAPRRLSPAVSGTSTRVLIPKSRPIPTARGQRVSDCTGDSTSGCWFSHTQPAGSSSTGSRSSVMTGLPGAFRMCPCIALPMGSCRITPT